MREIVQNLKFRRTGNGVDGQKLSVLLEKAYLSQRRETKHTQKKTFSPSTIGYGHGNCPRYWYLAFDGGMYVDSSDALGIANMSNGVKAHERIEELFEQAGILVDKEVEIELENPPVRGFIDVIIRWNDDVAIGEIKTARQEIFLHRKVQMKPSDNHLIQVLLYMKAMKIDKGFILYENKNNQEFIILPINMNQKNEEILNAVLDWMIEVRNAWENNEVPEKPFTKKSKVCTSCPMYDYCWSVEAPEGTTKIPTLEISKI